MATEESVGDGVGLSGEVVDGITCVRAAYEWDPGLNGGKWIEITIFPDAYTQVHGMPSGSPTRLILT
jgi:hypothetical protein